MKKNILSVILLLNGLSPLFLIAQDTVTINEIRLTSSLVRQSLLRTTTAAAIIDSVNLKLQATTSFVPAFNSIPGIRMEERSPGSYRLSLRGSLLRSPFGVRNVKIYLNEYPLTDAGGNTYINVVGMNAINSIEILKGPDGSLFGANSGGVVLLNANQQKDNITAEGGGGSYGLFKQQVGLTKNEGKHIINVSESYQRADGYRQNSQLRRFYIQLADEWQYSKNNKLKALAFYSDLYYQTPGGLNLSQYNADPFAARPATATLPGAIQQQTAIYNKMAFGGITHEARINKFIENTTAIFGTTVNFKNPFITDFEVRKENTYGARSFFSFSDKLKAANKLQWEYIIGIEWQQTNAALSNFVNNFGTKAAQTASGRILTDQHFIFNRFKIDINKKLIVEAGLSVNYYRYRFRDSAILNNNFKPQFMPRVAVSYSVLKNITVRASVSRGYSTPTTAEIRPSDNNIYRDLQAETGINKEFGFRYTTLSARLWIDAAVYNYKLTNAIVRQENTSGTEFFVNAGGTKQKAIELQASYRIIDKIQRSKWINKFNVGTSATLNNYVFSNYESSSVNYSGKAITGVPKQTFVSNAFLLFKNKIYLFIQHNYTAKLPLNDANTFYADSYNLVELKTGYQLTTHSVEIYAGVNNLLNEKYSLGNDLNAAGNRFYNAAPKRNYFAGIIFKISK